jgi:predicted RNase H-like HicB family nuclease
MKMKGGFTAVYEKRGNWYIAYIEEIPGVNTQGKTLREAKANLKEALKLILEANRELSLRSIGAEEKIKEPIFIETDTKYETV